MANRIRGPKEYVGLAWVVLIVPAVRPVKVLLNPAPTRARNPHARYATGCKGVSKLTGKVSAG
jgi:hypothetical protein